VDFDFFDEGEFGFTKAVNMLKGGFIIDEFTL